MPAPLVIMVDDNQSDLELSALAFEEVGLPVDFVGIHDPEAAALRFDALAADPQARLPRLILLDLNMPRVSGSEILERLRAHPRLSAIPVVVLTTSSAALDRSRSLTLGATEFQVKPHRLDAYLALFRSFARYLRPGGGAPPAPPTTPGPGPSGDPAPAPPTGSAGALQAWWRALGAGPLSHCFMN